MFDTYARNGNSIVNSNIKMQLLNQYSEYVFSTRKGTGNYTGRTMVSFEASPSGSKPIFRLTLNESTKTFDIYSEVSLEGGTFVQTCTPLSTSGNPCSGFNGSSAAPVGFFTFSQNGFSYTDKNKLSGTYSKTSKSSGGGITYTTKLDMKLEKVN
ncbi:MAG: hypothetical protein ACRCVT_10625 [Leadbetterella sp.]